jgi:hypothetical protein
MENGCAQSSIVADETYLTGAFFPANTPATPPAAASEPINRR